MLAGVEHAGPLGGDVGVVGERVPRPEHDVVERGDRGEVLDQRVAVVGALAEADRVHQRQRSDRLGEAALHQLDAGDQRGGDGAEADGQDAEAPVGRPHGRGGWCRHGGEAYGVVADPPRAYSRPVTAIVMDGNALRDELLDGLRDADRGRRVAADLPGDRARRRRPAEPALRPQQAAQGDRDRDAAAPRRPARRRRRRARSRRPSPSWPPIPTCTASSSSCRCRTASTPRR